MMLSDLAIGLNAVCPVQVRRAPQDDGWLSEVDEIGLERSAMSWKLLL